MNIFKKSLKKILHRIKIDLLSTFTITKKELKSLFFSPAGFIILTLFTVSTGIFFFIFPPFFLIGRAEMRGLFKILPFIFGVAIPAVTMRVYSEEFKTGSYEILQTLPFRTQNILMGKFWAVMGFIVAMLVPTLTYALSVSLLGALDWGTVIGGYIGALFLGGSMAAVGIFCSSLTRHQVVAFLISFFLLFFLLLIDKMVIILPGGLRNIAQYLSLAYHFENIAKGILDLRDLIYFGTLIGLSLYFTGLIVEEKK